MIQNTTPLLNQWFKDFVHNTLVHPILPFLPSQIANRIHDVNAAWAFEEQYGTPSD